MSELRYRTVDVSVRVYSGSDDHAKHTVYWALEPENVVFRDDDVYTLEHILSAVGNGEPIDDAYRDEAARLLEHVVWDGWDVMIKKLEIVQKCSCVVADVDTEPLDHDDDCPVYRNMIDQYEERGGI